MDSFCEDAMGYAKVLNDHPNSSPTRDANARINDARISEIAFLIRRASVTPLGDTDVWQLASLMASVTQDGQLSRARLEAALRDAGRSQEDVGKLLGAIFR